MRVRISVDIGIGDYEVSLDWPETNGEAWGSDREHVNRMVDTAVTQIKRAYTNPVKEVDDELRRAGSED